MGQNEASLSAMAKIIELQATDPAYIKNRTIAILGYGNQGRAQALNLRDRGCRVIVGARAGGKGWESASADGFDPLPLALASQGADLLMMTLPDESMADIYSREIAEFVSPGKTLMVCHGFAFHFGYIAPPPGVDVALAAPKGSGASLRAAFTSGRSLAGLYAVLQDVSGTAHETALSYLWGIGCAGTLVIETSFEEECVTDLFGEQVVLCGGIPELIKAAFETLVEAGYSPESAYLECLHEAKLITDLLYERGLSGMRQAISDTAEWGGYTVGGRIVSDETKATMREALSQIQGGAFAKEWLAEAQTGKRRLLKYRDSEAQSRLEDVGRALRPNLLDQSQR